ncbi:hypothetical protein BBJ28_00012169 [Nothophytophthora sp. Chile5]|nr:hypothetical protein BBJ28_00012169 [Nothophytophthora sp. Chile5]
MTGRRGLLFLNPNTAVAARLGFAPHQLSAMVQTRADTRPADFGPKAHHDPIVASKMKWRVFSTAGQPAAKFSTAARVSPKMPIFQQSPSSTPHVKAAKEAPMSLKHLTEPSSTKKPLEPSAKATASNESPMWQNPVPHPVYNLETIAIIPQTHHEPKEIHERVALLAVKALRGGFDLASWYRGPGGGMTERDWLHRCLFLETVAGVPGMVAGMARHLRSLRSMQRDYGWIHTLLEEAENERMHLLIFMNMKEPGWGFRMAVLGAQGVFFNAFFVTYLVSPRTCHRFVGYLEEEAVKTYTGLLKDIEDGHLEEWRTQTAPLIGRNYYNLPEDAKIYDMIKCIRADEANHRDVNHTFAGLDQDKGVNPFMDKH